MSIKLTISLVTYNGEKYLLHCLKSLFSQSYKDWQLFILDNGSRDKTREITKQLVCDKKNITALPSKQNNTGFARAHNEIIKQTESEYILLLNQDIILEPDYLEKIINFLDKKNKAGAISGKLLRWQIIDNLVKKTDIIDSVGLEIHKNFQIVEIGAGKKDKGKHDNNEEVFGVSGALPCYRREALEQVGYFDKSRTTFEVLDKRFFSYKEDVDLAFRLQNANWQAYCIGGAVAYHERGLRVGQNDRDIAVFKNRSFKSSFGNYLSYRNHLFILIKNVALLDWVKYGIFIFWYELKKLGYLLVFEQKTLYAWVEVIWSLSKFLQQRSKIQPKSVSKWVGHN